MRFRLFATLLLVAVTATAAENVVVVRAARMIDGKSAKVIAPAMVVIRGNQIDAIGGTAPANAKVIDLGDMTLLPGLIDAHVHALLQGDITAEDYDKQLFKESLAYRALRASSAVKIALEQRLHDRCAISRPRARCTPTSTSSAPSTTASSPARAWSSRRARCRSPAATDRAAIRPKSRTRWACRSSTAWTGAQSGARADRARRRLDQGLRRSLVLRRRRTATLSSIPTFTLEEMKAIVDESHRLRHKVAAHAMARPGIENALTAGVDSIEHGIAIPDDLLDVDGRERNLALPDADRDRIRCAGTRGGRSRDLGEDARRSSRLVRPRAAKAA